MSEIWTPGDPPPSQPSGGIELPKGFSTSRRREAEERPAESESPAAAGVGRPPAAEAPAAPHEETARPEANFLFPPSGARVTCPNCGNTYTAAVFSIVDLGANPELRQLLLAGQINAAMCSTCGAGGPLSAPLMIHDPENDFLGVIVPGQARVDDMQMQKAIGEMSQTLMGRLSPEERKGYMFQPQQFLDWDTLLEKLWGFEGVTPEMLRRRREQTELVGNLVRLGSDEGAMRLVAERNAGLIDSGFFTLLGQVLAAVEAEGRTEQQEALANLRSHLLETTEAGREIRELEARVEAALAKIGPRTTPDQLLTQLVGYWQEGQKGEAVAMAVLTAAAGLTDYRFLLGLADRLENSTDPEERSALIALRERIVEIGEQRAQGQQAAAQQAQELLQTVLQAQDTDAALEEIEDQIDDMFLAVLANSVKQAEENKAAFAVQRLRVIYEKAVGLLEKRLPKEIRLLNRLLGAPDEGALRRLLQENRAELSREFVDGLKTLESRFHAEGNAELSARVRSIRGQAALLL